ncbi:MAG TPA: cation:proton antiporter [Actinomycetales bacterium]|nr:cation:proton antiporter [Actinomycetales bacterium]
MTGDAAFLVGGLGLLLAAVAARLLKDRALSTPIFVLLIGAVVGIPLRDSSPVSPVINTEFAEHLTEACVIVALMGVGLSIDRPLSRKGWRSPGRLLLLAMPLCIAGVALLGWSLMGLAPAAALLLGAVLAPTDPVLASDVQVAGPATGEQEYENEIAVGEHDEVRFALTSEAGLNDGLAFPFVYAAIFLASLGSVGEWGLRWLAWELVGKVALGVVLGWLAGKGLAWLSFRSQVRTLRLAEGGQPLLALAVTFAVYGLVEVLGGYGFVAVFVCALAMRTTERHHEFHADAHRFMEQLEHILTFVVLLLLGAALTSGLLANLTWQGVVVGVLLLVVIRPLAAWLSLLRFDGMDSRERAVSSFFGVRGVGSLYYVAYAMSETGFDDARVIWSTVTFTVVLSVLLHGVTATPAMSWLERHRDRAPR